MRYVSLLHAILFRRHISGFPLRRIAKRRFLLDTGIGSSFDAYQPSQRSLGTGARCCNSYEANTKRRVARPQDDANFIYRCLNPIRTCPQINKIANRHAWLSVSLAFETCAMLVAFRGQCTSIRIVSKFGRDRHCRILLAAKNLLKRDKKSYKHENISKVFSLR